MSPQMNLGGWIHIFTVTDTQTHKGGYTIYKITSVVFPRSVPQALTCLTVWKRFHDVKRLHRELARRHKSLHLSGQLPKPTDCSFFKRFNADVIQRRKKYILQLLDFAAQHTALYKCHAFAQFFADAQQFGGSGQRTPLTQSPKHHELHLLGRPSSKAETAPGTTNVIAEICNDTHPNSTTPLEPTSKTDKTAPIADSNEDNVDGTMPPLCAASTEEKPCKDYTRFLTPMASIESDDSDYIYEAALEFSYAVQAEANLEYQEAYVHYKRGVELLLNGAKDDSNDDRKFIAKAKISKYLARADDIYDKFLCSDNIAGQGGVSRLNFQLSIDVSDADEECMTRTMYLERPWNHLAKYKVLQVLGGRVMQVQCITEPQRPTYVMKGIEKPSSNQPTQTIFLPQNVPYMVELVGFFQSEQKIFLLLKQAKGSRLYDYIQSYQRKTTTASTSDYGKLFPEVNGEGELTENTALMPTSSTEHSELVRCSQELLQSVSNTLNAVEQKKEHTPRQEVPRNPVEFVTRIPEASLKQWARELAVAIHSLHTKGVILSDLHMDNLLLGAKGQLLLTYFYQHEGQCTAAADNYVHKALSVRALAGHFVAPERPLTCKSDWWSFGVVLYQLLLGLPFKATHPGHIDLYGCVQYPAEVEISDCACDLLEHLLQQTPEERYDYAQLQAHAFFAGTNWTDVERNGLNNSNT